MILTLCCDSPFAVIICEVYHVHESVIRLF